MHRVKFNDYAELLSDDLNNNNAYLYNGLITTIADFIAANDCVSGLEVTAQAVPDMTVYVKAGRIYQDGYQGFLEADLTTPLTIAPASANQPRIDLICAKYEEVEDEPEIRNVMTDVVSRNITQVEVKTRIASSIAFQVVGGTAAAEPTVPTTPEGWVALAKVTIPANTSVIQQSNIVDMRPKIINIYQHDHSGGANGAKLDYNNLENLPDLSVFKGATTSNNGTKGMVPAPAKGNNNRYLKSDGTWGEIDTMQGATSGAAGKSGLVPVPTAGANNRYLSADGTWKTISGMNGATSSAAGAAGLVPTPAKGDQNKALFGDATYKQVVQKVNGVAADGAGNVNVDTFAETEIAVNADLNNFLDDGFYVALTNNIFNTIQNKPENGAFYLQVVRGKLTTQRYQILFNISTNTIWTRTNITGNNWGAWVKLAKETEVALPVGTILPFAGGSIPSGFLACNGAGVSATTYADLYAVIGNTYGGNSTTFNLPQIEDNRFLEFSSTRGTQKNAGLPNVTGEFDVRRGYNQYGADDGTLEGAFVFNSSNNAFTSATKQTNSAQNTEYGIEIVGTTRVAFNAANANSIYGGSTTVQPKSLTVRAIIKY